MQFADKPAANAARNRRMDPLNQDSSADPQSTDANQPVVNPQPIELNRQPRGYAGIAWVVIALMCAAAYAIHVLEVRKPPPPEQANSDNPIDAMLFDLQGKYIVAAADMYDGGALYGTIEKTMDVGTVKQRQKFAVIAGELLGPEQAISKLDHLEELIAQEELKRDNDKPVATPSQTYTLEALRQLYEARAIDDELPDEGQPPASLPETDREKLRDMGIEVGDAMEVDRDAEDSLLVNELGWFGKLALTSRDSENKDARNEVMAPARTLMWFIIGIAVAGGVAGFAGFAGLAVMFVMAILRKVRGILVAPGPYHGIYAETFALWMVLFFALQFAAGAASKLVPQLALPIVFVAFLVSLVALVWPVMRGITWPQVKCDIGWHGGRSTSFELLTGVGGYFMALPILAIGVAITYVLMMIQQTALKAPGPIFEPPSGPSHPIIEQLTGPDWSPKIMVLALGAIAAPIIEETMFRGVLYSHLRGASRKWGAISSVVFSTLVNSFIFAFIHPQGWVAIPALMSLAIAFSLVREWRGSILPPMIMHGMSNFIVMSLLITALQLSR